MQEFFDKRYVPGEGPKNAAIMLIGEAPGAEEAEQGRPFVGKAGKNLDEFLSLIDLPRESVYITNVIKYRPYKVSDIGTVSNRTPTWQECLAHRKELVSEIMEISPEIIVTLGNTPLRAVTGDPQASIGKMHGVLHGNGKFKLFPLYHPASIIYNPSLRQVYEKDVLNLKKIL